MKPPKDRFIWCLSSMTNWNARQSKGNNIRSVKVCWLVDAFTLRGSMCFDQVSRYFRSQSIEWERERKKRKSERRKKSERGRERGKPELHWTIREEGSFSGKWLTSTGLPMIYFLFLIETEMEARWLADRYLVIGICVWECTCAYVCVCMLVVCVCKPMCVCIPSYPFAYVLVACMWFILHSLLCLWEENQYRYLY